MKEVDRKNRRNFYEARPHEKERHTFSKIRGAVGIEIGGEDSINTACQW